MFSTSIDSEVIEVPLFIVTTEGEARQLMTGFNRTDAEYDEAIALLRSTYGNSKRLTEAHLHAVLDLNSPPATSCELSKFRSGYEGHLRGLKSLNQDIENTVFVFAAVLLRKLPVKIRDNINREGKADFLGSPES